MITILEKVDVLDCPNDVDLILDEVHEKLIYLKLNESAIFKIQGIRYLIIPDTVEKIDGVEYFTYTIETPDGEKMEGLNFRDVYQFLCKKIMDAYIE